MRLLRLLLVCVVFICCCVGALAQTGAIQGTVTDKTGAVVAGATITVVNQATGASRTATSSASGAYSIPNLAVSNYSISVEKSGFSPVKVASVTVTVGEILPVNASMDVGAVQETVTVEGSNAAPIETESTQVSNLVDETRVKALPLITRNPYELVLLSPGATQSNANGGININGSRDRNNNFLLDGVDNNDTSVPGILGGAISSNPENTEEFRVVTDNFNAEYGRNTGAIIDVVTKSGTNNIHFDAYWFGRYDKIGGARDWFNPATGPTGGPENPYVRNQFGYSFGAPIVKNKTFFFFNQEFQRFPTAQTASLVVPTPQFLSGKFTWHGIGHPSANDPTSIPVSVNVDLTPGSAQNQFFAGTVFGSPAAPGLDPTMAKVFALYPTPATLNPDGMSGLVFFPNSSDTRSYEITTKLDHRFTETEVMSIRYGYDPLKDPNPAFDATLPGNVGATSLDAIGQGLSVNLTSTLRSTLVNSLTFGWNHIIADFACQGLSTLNSPYPVDQFGHGAEFVMGPFGNFACARGGALADGQGRTTGTTSYSDALSWVKGSHTWKFGAEFRDIHEQGNSNFGQRRQISTNIGTAFGGFDTIGAAQTVTSDNGAKFDPTTVDFTTLSDAAGAWFGMAIGDSQSQFFNKDGSRRGDDEKFYIQHEYGIYAQDSWKLRRNLTLNLGLRYQFNGVPYEKNGNQSNLFTDPRSFPVVFQLTGPGSGHLLYNNDFSNLEPRVGFSWDPWGDGKTAVRGSFGIFHDRIFGNLFGNARSNPPFQASYTAQPFETINNALFNAGLFPLQPPNQPFTPSIPNGALQAPEIFPQNFRSPSLNSWFLGVQRQMPGQMVADISYVGNQGHHIFRDIDANPPEPALVAQLLAFCSVPNPLNCTPDTVSGAGNLYSGKEFGSLPFNAVPFNAIGRGPVFSAVLVDSGGNSNYNSLQVKVTKRPMHGLQLQGAYTWSHAIDDSNDPIVAGGNGVNFVRNPLDPGQDRGNSDHDIRHVAVISYIYEMPFGRGKSFVNGGLLGRVLEGFQLSGIMTTQSGRAFDIIGTRDSQRVGRVGRTDLTGDPFAASSTVFPVGTKVFFANPGAFTNPPFGRAGEVGRNQFHGPSFFNTDASLSKTTRLTERLALETRLEVYNVLNHPNFATPGEGDFQGNDLGTPLFGAITQQIGRPDLTTGARQLQMAAKLIF
jgi:hypothetical protein